MSAVDRLGISGVLSSWEEYSTDTSSSALGSNPKKYTIPELLELINDIKRVFNPKALERFMLLIEEHLHDTDNPHRTTLESMGTSVIIELYKEWLELGYSGTREEFIKILFQYVEIADIPTTKAGISTSKLVSVKGAKAIYDEHIISPDAHTEMFRAIFPGNVPSDNPIWSCQAFVGQNPDMVVERPAPCFYHRQDGYLDIAPANTLPIDNLYGYPMFSIWGKRKNLVRYSNDLNSGGFVGGYKSDLLSFPSPRNITDGIMFHETLGGSGSEHGWVTEPIAFEAGKVYTFSAFVFPRLRMYFTLGIPEVLAGPNAQIHYDLRDPDNKYIPVDMDKTINDGEMIILPNRWVKVIHSFRAKASITMSLKALWLDTIDTNTAYVGSGTIAGFMWQAQVEEGLGASPPIINGEFLEERPATKVKIPFDNLFNNKTGALVIETKQPYKIQQNEAHYLYEVGSVNGTTLHGKFPITHEQRLYMESINIQKSILDYSWTGNILRDFVTYVHSYSSNYHTYGNTGNFPITNSVFDNSITTPVALEYFLLNIWPQIINDNTVNAALISFDNNVNPTPTDLPDNYVEFSLPDDVEANAIYLDYILEDIVPTVYANREDNGLAIINLVRREDLLDLTTVLNDEYDFLIIGCNRNGEEQLNGYIRNITYYHVYSDDLVTEFYIGEYPHGL
jgi:hypothetical protein